MLKKKLLRIIIVQIINRTNQDAVGCSVWNIIVYGERTISAQRIRRKIDLPTSVFLNLPQRIRKPPK